LEVLPEEEIELLGIMTAAEGGLELYMLSSDSHVLHDGDDQPNGIVMTLLQEYHNMFDELPIRLPPMWEVDHQII
ncbi:hypothetical protein LPJ61_005643, partial [Coemansia biformis]